MAKDTEQIVVGANGTVYTAPLATADPADISAPWGAGWVDLGFTSEDGVTFTVGKSITDIPVWQLFDIARKIVDGRTVQAAFVLRQFSGPNLELAWNATVESDGSNGFRLTPNAPEVIDYRKLGIEWLDGDNTYRLIISKGIVSEDVETKIVRNAATDLPITFALVGQANVDPFYLLTDDPTFAEAT